MLRPLDVNFFQFKMKNHTAMKNLMYKYCEIKGLKMVSLRFGFDGQRMLGEDTAKGLNMEEGDTIDVFREQPYHISHISEVCTDSINLCYYICYQCIDLNMLYSKCSIWCSLGIPVMRRRRGLRRTKWMRRRRVIKRTGK